MARRKKVEEKESPKEEVKEEQENSEEVEEQEIEETSDEPVKGFKLLVVAKESTGKTTMVSRLDNALIMCTDNKSFDFEVPHFRYSEYNGFDDMMDTIEEKLETYEDKFGKLPDTFVVDSVTHLSNAIEKYCKDKYTGFNVYSNYGADIVDFNAFLEDLIMEGINVVITAHCTYNPDINGYEIQAPGNFGKNGSWLSVVDNSIFITVKGNKRMVYTKAVKLPARTSIYNDTKETEISMEMDKYDINKHIKDLQNKSKKSSKWVL